MENFKKGQVQEGRAARGIQLVLALQFIKSTGYVEGYYDNKLQCIKCNTIARGNI